jgi:hypothetical protein
MALGLVLGAHVAGNLGYHAGIRHRLVAYLAAAAPAVTLALFAMHALSLPVLAGLMFWRGLAAAGLPQAGRSGALTGLAAAFAVVFGPLIGYLVIAGPGFVGAMVFDAAVLVFSSIILAPLDVDVPARHWRDAPRRALVWSAAVNLFAAGPLLTLTPARLSVAGYAAVLSVIGAGAVGGSVLAGRARGPAMLWLLPAAVGPLALAAGAPLPVVLAAFLVVGVVHSVHGVLLATELGPASGVEEVTSLAVLPPGQILGGLAAGALGLTATASLIAAGLCVLPLFSVARWPRRRTRRGTADIRSGSPASAVSR